MLSIYIFFYLRKSVCLSVLVHMCVSFSNTFALTCVHVQSVILGDDVKLDEVAKKLEGFRCVLPTGG